MRNDAEVPADACAEIARVRVVVEELRTLLAAAAAADRRADDAHQSSIQAKPSPEVTSAE